MYTKKYFTAEERSIYLWIIQFTFPFLDNVYFFNFELLLITQ